MDLDLAVRWEGMNLRRFLGAMRALRWEPKVPVLKPDLSYERLAPDAVRVCLLGRSARVVSVRRLLALKQSIKPPRLKDEFDIKTLKTILQHHED